MHTLIGVLAAVIGSAAMAQAPAFRVTLDQPVAASGRLVVQVIRDGAKLPPDTEPNDGPFWFDPQPSFGLDVRSLAPGASVILDDAADGFPVKPSALPAGKYRAQARLHVHRNNSDWRKHDGNLSGRAVRFEVVEGAAGTQVVELRLTEATKIENPPPPPNVEIVSVRSALLSAFHGRDVFLRASVWWPEPKPEPREHKFPAVYEVPGFGGDATEGFERPHPWRRALTEAESPLKALRAGAFFIKLDPESENGHTLFADSANNGPRGEALVKELIPALEARFPLIADPSARALRGHSSGGWAVLWLTLQYPQTFGACWSSAPDPVDFRRFQRTDAYAGGNFFEDAAHGGGATPSFRRAGQVLMTVRQEVGGEHVVGPRNTSAQQWASWQAVWGPKAEDGKPVYLFDPGTGQVDARVAEQYRRFDLGHLLRTEPERYAQIWHDRVRLVVGDQDNFYLNEAVALLKDDLEGLIVSQDRLGKWKPQARKGYITIVPGRDHGSVMGDPAVRAFPGQMLEFFKAGGHIQ